VVGMEEGLAGEISSMSKLHMKRRVTDL
jgi:hypothetical protein